jgi:uncharacterized protein (TIGR02996 family)
MNAEADFLAAIRAKPHDDALRLVYADWLEERATAVLSGAFQTLGTFPLAGGSTSDGLAAIRYDG